MTSFPVCTVCKQHFRWTGPDPYLLPCLHAVCETCLSSSATGSIRCLTCQEDITLNNTTLKKDQARKRLILNSMAKYHPTELKCTHKDDGNQAVCWCQECEEFFCVHCQKIHGEFKVTTRHTILQIFDIETFEPEAESSCSIHPKYVLELFDNDCKTPICLKCKQDDHSGHSTEDIDTVVESANEELSKNLEDIDDVQNKIAERLDENAREIVDLKETASAQREKIQLRFHTLGAMVDKRQDGITSCFDRHVDQANSANSAKRSLLSQHLDKASTISEYIQIVLGHASKSDIPILIGNIRNTVKECINSDLQKKVQYQPAVIFLDEHLQEAQSAISVFSGISYYGERITQYASAGQQRRDSLKLDESSDEDMPTVSMTEEKTTLQQRCEDLESETTLLKDTIASLQKQNELQQKALAVKEVHILHEKCLDQGIPLDSSFHLLKTESFSVKCVTLKFSSGTENTSFGHINTNGELCNKPGPGLLNSFNSAGPFKRWSVAEPLKQADFLQYMEASAVVELREMISLDELILEIGLWREDDDKGDGYDREPTNAFNMQVKRCIDHDCICTEIRKEGEYVQCMPDIFPHRPWQTASLHYGLAYDSSNRKIAFLDVKEGRVLVTFDNVDTSKPFKLMFDVLEKSRGSLNMKLVDGKEVAMTLEKKILLLKAMSTC